MNTMRPHKKAGTLQMTFWKAFFVNKICISFSDVSLNFVPGGPIDNKSALFQVMAWDPNGGDKPLPEPMFGQILQSNIASLAREVKAIPHSQYESKDNANITTTWNLLAV